MGRPVPAATATLQVLRYLSGRTSPVPAARIGAEVGLPRSTTYHLLHAMAAQSFVVHYPEDQTWGVGVAAWEVGQGYTRQEPLARLARVPLARLVDAVGLSGHLAVLHGSDVLYLIEERARGRDRLVSDVGVRLPAHLTATGRAILAGLPAAQVRALYPSGAGLVQRTGRGPRTLAELRTVLAAARRLGHAAEDSEVTEGFASLAVRVAAEPTPAAVALTWRADLDPDPAAVVVRLRATAAEIEARLG